MSLHALQHRLRQIGPAAIAVSGGIDSLTLACVAADLIPDSVIFHAVSPAGPEAATARVRTFAQDRGWHLNVIDAGEFSDMHYRANPVNRCFYCKTNLYGSIAAKTKSPILSGTNLDDLDDVRPGLIAAKDHNVQHPYVDAGIDKPGLRRIARDLGLGDIADLPAAPCLSSRVLTGLRIEPGPLIRRQRRDGLDADRLVTGGEVAHRGAGEQLLQGVLQGHFPGHPVGVDTTHGIRGHQHLDPGLTRQHDERAVQRLRRDIHRDGLLQHGLRAGRWAVGECPRQTGHDGQTEDKARQDGRQYGVSLHATPPRVSVIGSCSSKDDGGTIRGARGDDEVLA